MAEMRPRWSAERRTRAYSELEHPSDLFLQIRGDDLPELFENALFAFYDQIAEIEGFEARRELTLSVSEPELDVALRSLLSEALYRFDTEGFVAAGGRVGMQAPYQAGPPEAAADEAAPAGARDQAASSAPAWDEAAPSIPAAWHEAAPAGGRPGEWRLSAVLWGDYADRRHHVLLHEIKAVTYHRLTVGRSASGWEATVLLDI